VAVKLRQSGPLEPVEWPTGEEVAVHRPNVYAAAFWDTEVIAKPEQMREGLVKFVAMVCPSKTEDAIRAECDDDFLWLVANYSRERLEQAQAFLSELLGKSPAGTAAAPASAPPMPTGTSPVESPAPTAVPCGA
jgi:ABC-type glycerol-3-phosphate transport system substrate-binding protein